MEILTAKMDKRHVKYALLLQQRSLAAIETLFAEGRINAAAAVAMMRLAVDMERRIGATEQQEHTAPQIVIRIEYVNDWRHEA